MFLLIFAIRSYHLGYTFPYPGEEILRIVSFEVFFDRPRSLVRSPYPLVVGSTVTKQLDIAHPQITSADIDGEEATRLASKREDIHRCRKELLRRVQGKVLVYLGELNRQVAQLFIIHLQRLNKRFPTLWICHNVVQVVVEHKQE